MLMLMGRVRSTWLVELFVERLPITVIVAAAGVDTLAGTSTLRTSKRRLRIGAGHMGAVSPK